MQPTITSSPQHPLITQLAQLLGNSLAGYFTKPTIQSPIPQKQFPTPFQKNIQDIGQTINKTLTPMATYSQTNNHPTMPSPLPTMMPGQQQWEKANPQLQTMTPQQRGSLYEQGVNTPGGHYYGQQPSPTPQQGQVLADSSKNIQTEQGNNVLPSGIDKAINYIKMQTPSNVDINSYYPALADPSFMQGIMQADKMKPGLGNVLLMQAFHESTLGRSGNNIFGVLPGGEGGGKQASFPSPTEALQYQLGPNVLSGGANPNMNLLGEKGPLTKERLIQFYKSYNPEGVYIKQMLEALGS